MVAGRPWFPALPVVTRHSPASPVSRLLAGCRVSRSPAAPWWYCPTSPARFLLASEQIYATAVFHDPAASSMWLRDSGSCVGGLSLDGSGDSLWNLDPVPSLRTRSTDSVPESSLQPRCPKGCYRSRTKPVALPPGRWAPYRPLFGLQYASSVELKRREHQSSTVVLSASANCLQDST